jgi:hypothetical protein
MGCHTLIFKESQFAHQKSEYLVQVVVVVVFLNKGKGPVLLASYWVLTQLLTQLSGRLSIIEATQPE